MRLDAFDAFVFDLDGTLIDSGKYHTQAFADAVLAHSGHILTTAERNEFFASHSARFARELNTRHGLGLDPTAVQHYKRRRMEEIFRPEPFPGAPEFVRRWRGRKRLALASNSPSAFVLPALEALGLHDDFECITTADEVVHRKPAPEMFTLTMRRLSIAPARTLVFEDQLIGVAAARAAGAYVIAIDNGQPVDFPAEVPVTTWSALLENEGRV